ncbi:gfo/Idh/MocA family oxidoreductase [Photobacterium galatheae]|uniref:Gfo/Idh/MocA family oxidoreductase n=1 Tax=Photobacterium galatheae TaxID=1654360 RepID=UPI00202CB6FB|nr:Gfo/Idh/MocA family oxidoreductase [Photobacterium galatheae]MCM0147568.1 gfo/Idh/MocA family oxidoreductase [Photobacterium galatheae]
MIWLIGSGSMAVEYSSVLQSMDKEFIVVGRGIESATHFYEKTGHEVITGGLDKFLDSKPSMPLEAVVSVNVDFLHEITVKLLEYGVKRILVEKPGGISIDEIENLNKLTTKNGAELYIAYNRRFFASTQKLVELINQDGGLTSFHFDVTEWSHIISKLDKSRDAHENWFLANSTHVTDLAFFVGGKPKQLSCFHSGSLDWHTRGSIFYGAGVSECGALFNYNGNWESAGRWEAEFLTREHKFIMCPLETLKCIKRGTVIIQDIEIDDALDKQFKPGLYKQVEAFLSGNTKGLCSISEQLEMINIYNKISNY